MVNYWHQGKQRAIDEYQQALMRFYLSGEFNLPIVHFGQEVATPELGLIACERTLDDKRRRDRS